MKHIILTIILILALSYLYSEEFSWPQYRHDAQRTGRSDMNEGPQKKPYVAWWNSYVNGFVIGKDDNIFLAGSETYSMDKNGNQRWRSADVQNSYSPMINKDGTKFWVCDTDGYGDLYDLYILNPSNGAIIKRIPNRGCDNYVEDKDGFVYGVSWKDSLLYKFDADGNDVWNRKLKGFWRGHSISQTGDIYVLTTLTITCYDSSGTEKWSKEGNSINIRYYDYPVIAPDGTIYVMGSPQTVGLIAFNQDGTEKWATKTIGGWSLGLTSDGTIYYLGEYYVNAINPDGSIKWVKNLDIGGSMVIDSNDYLYSRDKRGFFCFDTNGNELWKFSFDKNGNIYALGTNKTLYAYSTGDDRIYAIKEDTGFSSSNSSSCLPDKHFSISPNPFTGRLSISSSSSASIYSLTGQLIMELPKGKHSLDTSKWREGVYIVKSGKECKRVVKVK
ncbi:MAG: PQQ-like beta-propeller repeat protein [Candidatus Coatesbacteria bacterium]|nr:PQQ-like beta-propeller repeat protein [Candidatus Coatesbacteria bacterium]